MITNTLATLEEHASDGLLDGAIASLLDQLQTAGYVKKSLRDKRTRGQEYLSRKRSSSNLFRS